jgi:hypothetical protein
MKERFFQALDIIHLWADRQRLPVSFSLNEISVSCETDLSQDAEKVCNFISFIIKNHWTYRIVKENDEYRFIFYETCEPLIKETPVLQPDVKKRKKRRKTAKPPETKGLF